MNDCRINFSDAKYREREESLQPFKVKMVELAKDRAMGLILDVGCGTGLVSRLLRKAGWTVVGFDISSEGIRRYVSAGFAGLLADAEDGLPFKKDSLDAIWMSEVIEHLVNYLTLIKEIRRILKPGGRLFLTAPNSAFYGYRAMYLLGKTPTELQHPFHLRFFSFKFLRRMLLANGFGVDRLMGQNVYFLIPGKVLRVLDKKSEWVSSTVLRWLKALGFRRSAGLIHGDKYICYRFSSTWTSLLSNVIMLVARKV